MILTWILACTPTVETTPGASAAPAAAPEAPAATAKSEPAAAAAPAPATPSPPPPDPRENPVPAALAARFRAEPLPWSAPRASSADLAAVAAESLRAVREMQAAAGTPEARPPEGLPAAFAGTPADTLAWIVRVAEADRATGADRLADPTFLDRCLATWRWVPTVTRPGEALRLTRYLVYSVTGRATPEGSFQHALWKVPRDESGLAAAEADARKDTLDRFRYTRQDVAAGVYRDGGAAAGRADPLVWLTHDDHEQAILQGTVGVTLPGEAAPRLFNVHRHNGYPYDRTLRDTKLQRRYFYFQPRDAVRGWAAEPVTGAELRPFVAVAGDLPAIGYGRLLAIRAVDGIRLVVLADTGGAFEDNLSQLDLYTGIYPSRAAFDAATKAVGSTAATWVAAARAGVTGCE